MESNSKVNQAVIKFVLQAFWDKRYVWFRQGFLESKPGYDCSELQTQFSPLKNDYFGLESLAPFLACAIPHNFS